MTSSSRTQGGAALIVSLVMLVAITLVGVFVMSSSHLEWLMTNNSNFQTSAYMQAETNLQVAENTLRTTYFSPAVLISYSWGTSDQFFNDDPVAITPDPLPTGAASPDQVANWNNGAFNTFNTFVADYIGITTGTPPVYTFRVWAYASDGKGAARIVKSTYMAVPTPAPATFFPCIPNMANTLCWHRADFAEIAP